MSKVAIILIRGLVGVRHDIKDALMSLNLRKKHSCVILEDSPTLRGVLRKTQDLVTFGEVNDETIALLNEKRKIVGKVYLLHPPRGGFERKGIKKSFVVGGALGDRKDAINDLIKKML